MKAWEIEPTFDSWVDGWSRLPCMTARADKRSHWCGYVGLPQSHPWYGKDWAEITLNGNPPKVHGGLTFAGRRRNGPSGTEAYWWIGFDCAHAGDYVPKLPALSSGVGIYRDIDYAREQCRKLAAQAKEAAERSTAFTRAKRDGAR